MRFEVGDAVVHPVRGAGVITKVEEIERQEGSKRYYRIKLVAQPRTILRVPVGTTKERGMREAVPTSRLKRVWKVLDAEPQPLPSNHKKRSRVLRERMRTGDIIVVAQALRDLAWRRVDRGSLGQKDKRLYRRGVNLLAGEIAAAQEIDLEEAKLELWDKLRDGISH